MRIKTKTKLFNLKVSEEELRLIKANADKFGLSRSEYVRRMAIDGKIVDEDSTLTEDEIDTALSTVNWQGLR